MSTTYPQYPNSEFPDAADSWETFLNVEQSDALLIAQYQQYILNGDMASAQNIYSLIPNASKKFIGALVLNQLADAIMALETFYGNSGFTNYITTKQAEWQAIIDNFSYIGTYNNNTKYKKNNIVLYAVDGQKYLYLNIYDEETPKGTLPTNTTYWRVLTIQGKQGVAGSSTTFYFEWDSAAEYVTNNVVCVGSSLYVALQNNVNVNPVSNPSYWQLIFQSSVKHYPIQPEQPTSASVGDFWFKIV